MVIRSQEFSYEVLQVLEKDGRGGQFLGRCGGQMFQLISMGQADRIKEFFPCLLALEENAAFTDLKEYFLDDGLLWLVFSWHGGVSLSDYLGAGHGAGERYHLGRQIMEQLILMMMPDFLQCEVLRPERIRITDDGVPGFCYTFEGWKAAEKAGAGGNRAGGAGMAGAAGVAGADGVEVNGAGVNGVDGNGADRNSGGGNGDDGKPFAQKALLALEQVLETLLMEEEQNGLYPEWDSFLKDMKAGKWGEVLALYKGYLELLPAFAQERKKEKKKGGLWKRLKSELPRILAVVKIMLGLVVLAAAAAGVSGLWKEKVMPVLEAAAVWKSVYVDGEPLEPETEEETEPMTAVEPETETEPDPDNGRGERRREDGSLCYKGGLKDGLYDDMGTLYYADGTVAYQGGFSFGRKEGEGSLYTDSGILFYEGEFKKDRFEGNGKLYNADSGKLVYEGGFTGGRYSGEGVLYDPETEYPIYVGTFRLGRYDGNGLEYDSSGSLMYEGEFLLGKCHGKGTFYDPATGAVLLEGEFRNDIYIGPGDEENAGGGMTDAGGGNAAGGEGGMPAEGVGGTPAEGEGGTSAGDSGSQAAGSAAQAESTAGIGPGMTQASQENGNADRQPKEVGPGVQ